jgi:DNA topoisomerase I
LPKDLEIEAVTLERALDLIAIKAAQKGVTTTKKKATKKKATKKKAAAKKTTKKKASKKTAAKKADTE